MGRILTLLKHWREAKSAFSTLSHLYADGDQALDALGGLTAPEMAGLISWLPETGVAVEMGTLFGLTARAIAQARPRLQVIAVDNFCWNPFGLPPAVHERFTRQILAAELAAGRIQLLNRDSAAFRRAIDERRMAVPDVIFFDADHSYAAVKAELEWARRAGIRIIAGHDYGNPNPRFGVTRAVDEVFGSGRVEVAGMCWKAVNS